MTGDARKLTICASRRLTENASMTGATTIQAKAVEKIFHAAAKHGVNRSRLAAETGFDPSTLIDPDSRIPFSTVVRLYEKAAELTGDHAFGLHMGEHADPRAFDVLGYSVINSPTFGAALERVVRYNF